MANQVDNITLNDDTSGLIRAVDVANDDLFLSVDLTLQSGAVFESDNIKRGSGDPNGSVSGNEGDVFARTDAATGGLYVNTDGTNTGWEQVAFASGSPLSTVLSAGNTTGGTDIEISAGDGIVGESGPGATALTITAGSNTAGTGTGANVVISAGAGGVLGTAGDVILATQGFPAEPGDIQLNSSGAVLINPSADSTAQVNGSSVLQFNERASLVGVPTIAAGEGRIWVRSDTPNNLIFTDDASNDRLVVAPVGTPVTGDLLYYDGAEWTRLSLGTEGQVLTAGASDPQWAGPKRYSNSATDPVSPVPAEGDVYYNTALQMQMQYDGSRSKWLSVESATFGFGRNGNTGAGTYYRTYNGLLGSASRGYHALYEGTVVGVAYTRSDTDAATFSIQASGSEIATLASSATSGRNTAEDADFSQGSVLAIQNQLGGNTTSNVVVWLRVRWRA